MHTACMATSITIRNVPDDLRDILAARASANGMSMQAWVLERLTDLASRATNAEILERAASRAERSDAPVSTERIVELIREDRDRA